MDRLDDHRSGYYRPLISFLYALDHKIWGMDPAKFRATNLALHLLTCLALYGLLRCFVPRGDGPLWAVLFFGIHPANSESVAWIAARNNIAATLLVAASFYLYIKRTRDGRLWAGFPCLFCFFLGLLSKEFAMMLLPTIFLYDRIAGNGARKPLRPCYGYLAFLAALFPVLHIVPDSAVSIVAMRWLYFPMAFLCIAGAWAADRALVRWGRGYGAVIFGATALYLSSYTFILNESLWKNPNTFFRQEVLGFNNHFYLGDLANTYLVLARYSEAESWYLKALDSGADPVSVRKLLGRSYLAMGDFKSAVETLEEIPPTIVEKDLEIQKMLGKAREGLKGLHSLPANQE